MIATYGSPRRRGRTILGAVVPYDRIWRTGANEATMLVFDKDMTIGGAPVPAGAYSLWTIPKADGTVQLVINRQHGQWGTDYDHSQDLVRVPMKSSTAPSPQENFAINITGTGNTGELRMSWDAFIWSVPIAMKSVSRTFESGRAIFALRWRGSACNAFCAAMPFRRSSPCRARRRSRRSVG